MVPLPSCTLPALPDMTLLWSRTRRKLSGDQTRVSSERTVRNGGGVAAGSNLDHRARTVSPATLERQAAAVTHLYLSTSGPIASFSLTHVKGKFATYCLLGLLLMMTQPAAAKSPRNLVAPNGKLWIEEQMTQVIFRHQLCITKSPEELKRQLRLALGDDDLADGLIAGKRVNGYGQLDYQQDDPGVETLPDLDDTEVDSANEENVAAENAERDLYVYNNNRDESLEKTVTNDEELDRRTWLPRKKVLKRGMNRKGAARLSKDSPKNEAGFVEGETSSPQYPHMRRRRRSKVRGQLPQSAPGDEADTLEAPAKKDSYERMLNDAEAAAADKKGNNLLYLLWKSGKNNKTLRQEIKKKLRKDLRPTLSEPWDCQLVHETKERAGYFPPHIQEGYCAKSNCFYNLYDCRPEYYTLKLLHRDPTKCNPLPTLSNVTIYEERWEIKSLSVTVACKCVSRFTNGGQYRGRYLRPSG